MVSPREHELVFTIRDCTGTDYSFEERSAGLKYFLSYHVQLLAHQPPATGQSEILLMDEPDAYLSNQGQQDLLRILEAFGIHLSSSIVMPVTASVLAREITTSRSDRHWARSSAKHRSSVDRTCLLRAWPTKFCSPA